MRDIRLKTETEIKMKFELVATCLFGLEHLLGEEIEALGYERTETIDGRVTFLGDPEAVALSNIFLRSILAAL